MKVRHLAKMALVLASTSTTVAAGDSPARVKADVLVKSSQSWNGTPYRRYPDGPPELTVLRLTIPPHTTLPWHTHPMPNASYIISGQLTVEDRASGKKHVVKAGEAFNEQVGTEHRGRTDDEPCTVIVTYSGTSGMPISIPAPGEKHEY